ncbi:hypothetical protein C8R45DRAFT_1103548 [Mycena sanguinolenta]|nr:hypothetical protein C8R45DRAFT_1103548 [Mycena sanguinolenta]
MQFRALFLAFVATAVAFQRPTGGPDGLYIHSIDAEGNSVVEYLGVASTSSNHIPRAAGPSAKFGKRDGVTCGGGSGSAGDFAQADQMLANFFGNGNTFKGKDIAYYYGSAVAFGCNYGNGQTDTASQWDSNVNDINQDCGVAGSGWYSYPSSKASFGRTLSSESFC